VSPAGRIGRWGVENRIKYDAEHHGTDLICDYVFALVPDDRVIDNPERKKANTAFAGRPRRAREVPRRVRGHARRPGRRRRSQEPRPHPPAPNATSPAPDGR
jgi:hypothetical protein